MIRTGLPPDAAQICEIYNHYVRETVVTFEEEPVAEREMAQRMAEVTERLPWFVWEEGGAIAGYAYATAGWQFGTTSASWWKTSTDGHGRLELSRFLAPTVAADHRSAPVNALGYLRVMFAVEDLDDTLARLVRLGAKLVGDVVQYENTYRLCYIRGPEGILIGLAQQLGQQASREDPLR